MALQSGHRFVVFVLWHITHADPEPGEMAHHRDDGEVCIDEQAGDDVKLLGIHSTAEAVRRRNSSRASRS